MGNVWSEITACCQEIRSRRGSEALLRSEDYFSPHSSVSTIQLPAEPRVVQRHPVSEPTSTVNHDTNRGATSTLNSGTSSGTTSELTRGAMRATSTLSSEAGSGTTSALTRGAIVATSTLNSGTRSGTTSTLRRAMGVSSTLSSEAGSGATSTLSRGAIVATSTLNSGSSSGATSVSYACAAGIIPKARDESTRTRSHEPTSGVGPSGLMRSSGLSRSTFPSGPVRSSETAAALPEPCRRHGSRVGCDGASCRRLHLCRLFLADICNFGEACRFGHSLATEHNQKVCRAYNLDTTRELTAIQKLMTAFDGNGWLSEDSYIQHLEVCFRWFSDNNPCMDFECRRIHICRKFVAGTCSRSACLFGHDLHTTHNNDVLSRHKATRLSDEAILELLRHKEKQQQLARHKAAGAPASGSGKDKREGAAGDEKSKAVGDGGRPTSGLDKELECPLCLDMLDRATTLGCGHTFCAGCLAEARKIAAKCPLCRQPIVTATRSVILDNIISSIIENR